MLGLADGFFNNLDDHELALVVVSIVVKIHRHDPKFKRGILSVFVRS